MLTSVEQLPGSIRSPAKSGVAGHWRPAAFCETITPGTDLRQVESHHVEPKGSDAFVIWIALTISVISLATALVALWWARLAHDLVRESKRPAPLSEQRLVLDSTDSWLMEELDPDESVRQQHVASALANADSLSDACHTVIRALDAGGEPPTSNDYARVQQCSDLFTVSVDRMRAPHHGDLVRELTDELVTLHHCVTTEVGQHQEARFPFVGARDTTLASRVLRTFDAEVARLRLYARTGSVPEPNLFPVDFDTVRFVPRQATTPPAPDSGAPETHSYGA